MCTPRAPRHVTVHHTQAWTPAGWVKGTGLPPPAAPSSPLCSLSPTWHWCCPGDPLLCLPLTASPVTSHKTALHSVHLRTHLVSCPAGLRTPCCPGVQRWAPWQARETLWNSGPHRQGQAAPQTQTPRRSQDPSPSQDPRRETPVPTGGLATVLPLPPFPLWEPRRAPGCGLLLYNWALQKSAGSRACSPRQP